MASKFKPKEKKEEKALPVSERETPKETPEELKVKTEPERRVIVDEAKQI